MHIECSDVFFDLMTASVRSDSRGSDALHVQVMAEAGSKVEERRYAHREPLRLVGKVVDPAPISRFRARGPTHSLNSRRKWSWNRCCAQSIGA